MRRLGRHLEAVARDTPLIFHLTPSEAADSRQRGNQREKSMASCLFIFGYFRSSTRGRFLLLFCPIVINSGTEEIFQGTLIDLVVLMNVDRTSHVAFKAGVEEA